jgi:hypothetical protein
VLQMNPYTKFTFHDTKLTLTLRYKNGDVTSTFLLYMSLSLKKEIFAAAIFCQESVGACVNHYHVNLALGEFAWNNIVWHGCSLYVENPTVTPILKPCALRSKNWWKRKDIFRTFNAVSIQEMVFGWSIL